MIQFKPGQVVDPDLIAKEVEQAGFAVGGLAIQVRMPKVTIEQDHHIKIAQRWYHFVNAKGKQIEGEVTLQFIDKQFVEKVRFVQFAGKTEHSCYQTGKMAACCSSSDQPSGRIYHVTL